MRLRRERILQLTSLVTALDRFTLPPMMLAVARDLQIPVASVAAAAAAYFFSYGLMQPVWGLIGARVGVIRLMRVTTLVGAAATLSSGLATGAASLIVLRLLAGAAISNGYPSALYYAGATAPPGQRHREITTLMAGMALGTSLGTAGGGVLAATVGWRAAFVVTGAAALALWLNVRHLAELPRAPAAEGGVLGPVREVVRSRPARAVGVLFLVEGAVLLGVLTFLPAAAEAGGAGTAVAGLATAVFGLAVLVLAPVVGRLQRRIPPPGLIAAGGACAVVACAVAVLTVHTAAVVLICLLLGAAWSSMHSTFQTWATEVVPRAGLAAISLFAMSLFVGSCTATLLAGPLAQQGRFTLIFAVATALAVPLALVGTLARARLH